MKKIILAALIAFTSLTIYSQKRINLLFDSNQKSMHYYVIQDTMFVFDYNEFISLVFKKNLDCKSDVISLDSLNNTTFMSIDTLIARDKKNPFYILFELDNVYVYDSDVLKNEVKVNRVNYVDVSD